MRAAPDQLRRGINLFRISIENIPMTVDSLRVLHLVSSIGRGSYGLGAVVLSLMRHQKQSGVNPQVWCLDDQSDLQWAMACYGLQPSDFKTFHHVGPALLSYAPQMEWAVKTNIGGRFDVIHQHGVWTGLSRVANSYRNVNRKPVIITPHGSLEAWALRRSSWKKHLALWAYERRNLQQAACLHALAESEAVSFRRFGLRNPIAVIPNGIAEEWLNSSGDGAAFRARFNIAHDTRILLFLGRITPKKGLPMLITAMSATRDRLTGWQLIIAGGSEFHHQSEVESFVKQSGLRDQVKFIGPVFGPDKRNAYAAADLFVLPTHSEGAPMVVLEALGASVPVLTTKGTPWQDLVTCGGGWWTAISVEGITAALREALAASPDRLRAMGARGQWLIADQYRWSKIAEMTLELYRWLLGRGPRPEFVFLD